MMQATSNRASPPPGSEITPEDAWSPAWLSTRHPALSYAVALATTALATVARAALAPLFDARYPFTTFYVAVVVASSVGGFGPGLLATVAGAFTALFVWIAPRWASLPDEPRDVVGFAIFVASGVAISFATHALQRSIARERRVRAEAQATRAESDALRLRAEEAMLAREDVQAMVAHDLRSPLGVISLQAGMLQRCGIPGPDGDDVRRRAESVARAASHMSVLIRDLLDAASIEAGRLSIEPARDDVRATLRAAIELVTPAAAAKGMTVEAALPDGAQAEWDRGRMLQLIGNLLDNAVKFTPPGGDVRVEAAADEDVVRISVSDDGSGIPAEQLPHLFERFWKGKRSAGGGTGLGLFIAAGIAAAHGGRIDVSSAPGTGTTFRVTVPAKRPPPAGA